MWFLAHEVMHVVLMHHIRRQERHAEKWNVAADYAINNHLIVNGFILPEGGLVDDQYADMSTEHIYNLLPEPPQGFGQLLASVDCGGVLSSRLTNGQATAENISAIESQLTVAINLVQKLQKHMCRC